MISYGHTVVNPVVLSTPKTPRPQYAPSPEESPVLARQRQKRGYEESWGPQLRLLRGKTSTQAYCEGPVGEEGRRRR